MSFKFQPLIVRITVLTGILVPLRRQPYPIHFDALVISLLAARNKQGIVLDYDPAKDPYAPGGRLAGTVPLAASGSKSPVYQASVAFVGKASSGWHSWIKRPPTQDMYEPNQTFSPSGDGSGPRRGWLEAQEAVYPLRLSFFCVGDKDALEDILADLRGVGVMRRSGLGEVVRCDVIAPSNLPADFAANCGLIWDGLPARELPLADWPEGMPATAGWTWGVAAVRPPYWVPHNKERCWLPPDDMTAPCCATYLEKGVSA